MPAREEGEVHAMDRGQFLRLGAAGAVAAVAGAVSAPAAGAVGPAPAPQGDDIGFVQWAATAEMVAIACWDRVLGGVRLDEHADRWVHALRRADTGHLAALNAVLGEEAPTEEDFAVKLPKRAFATQARALAQAEEIHDHLVRVYLQGRRAGDATPARACCSASCWSTTPSTSTRCARCAGSRSAFAGLRGPLDLEPAGAWLDGYLRVRS